MQTIHDAIYAAADHIEQNPHLFLFYHSRVPGGDYPFGETGCALGRIGAIAGVAAGTNVFFIAEALGVSEQVFYQRMVELSSHGWWRDARNCAKGLRAYADKWHAGRVPYDAIPKSVRMLFEKHDLQYPPDLKKIGWMGGPVVEQRTVRMVDVLNCSYTTTYTMEYAPPPVYPEAVTA